MNFGYPIDFTVKALPIKYSSKYLRVYFNNKLTIRDHIELVLKTSNKFSGIIYEARPMYPVKCLLTFIVRLLNLSSHIVCLSMAVPQNEFEKKLENTQRRLLRAISSTINMIVSDKFSIRLVF